MYKIHISDLTLKPGDGFNFINQTPCHYSPFKSNDELNTHTDAKYPLMNMEFDSFDPDIDLYAEEPTLTNSGSSFRNSSKITLKSSKDIISVLKNNDTDLFSIPIINNGMLLEKPKISCKFKFISNHDDFHHFIGSNPMMSLHTLDESRYISNPFSKYLRSVRFPDDTLSLFIFASSKRGE